MNKAVTDGAQLMPPAFAQAPRAFALGDGTPGPGPQKDHIRIVPEDPDFGSCLELVKSEPTQSLRYSGETPLLPGCYLRVSARVKAVSGPLPSVRIAGFAGGAWGHAVAGAQTKGPGVSLTEYGAVVEVSAIVGAGARGGVDMVWGAAALFGHFGLDLTGPGGAVVRIENLVIEDVTSAFLRDMIAVVDVRDYGAVGDGETDDSGAFIAANTRAEGRSILVSRGRYYLGSDVRLDAPVVFEGTVRMPQRSVLLLCRNLDLASYGAAFGDAATGLGKGIQALISAPDQHRFDMGGGTVMLEAPLVVPEVVQAPGQARKTLCNGVIRAQASPHWATEMVVCQARYDPADPLVLTGLRDLDQIAPGALVQGSGVPGDIYVSGRDVAAGSLSLSAPLDGVTGAHEFTFTRFRYLLDFSGLTALHRLALCDVQLLCDGQASGIMMALEGAHFTLRDSVIRDVRDRGLTSAGTGCAGLVLERCGFNNEGGSLPVSGLGFNARSLGVRVVNCHGQGVETFGRISGAHAFVTGTHVQLPSGAWQADEAVIVT